MSVRQLVPVSLQPAVQSAYVRLGSVTSGARLLPSFMVVGGQRCGTTSMFKALSEHPQVFRPPVNKGTDYYTLYYYRSPEWYRGHFPLARPARWRTIGHGQPMAFEACTYYMFHPFAIERIARDFPGMKLIAVLRDPVERAFSAYKHELARGFEWETDFEHALDLEPERLVGEVERMRTDLTYESFAHRHHAYLQRGQYAEQLTRMLEYFSPEQLHVMESERFFEDPSAEFERLVDFLGLVPFQPARFDQHNARPSSPMPDRMKLRLVEHYAPHDEKLEAILGHPPTWAGAR